MFVTREREQYRKRFLFAVQPSRVILYKANGKLKKEKKRMGKDRHKNGMNEKKTEISLWDNASKQPIAVPGDLLHMEGLRSAIPGRGV